MPRNGFKCPKCGGLCIYQRDLSVTAVKDPNDKVLFYVCNGRNYRHPHDPILWRVREGSAKEGDKAGIEALVKTMHLDGIHIDILQNYKDDFKQWAAKAFTPEHLKIRESWKRPPT